MLSPYKGKFRVSQEFKPGIHNGLDLVGNDKNLYAVFDGKIEIAGPNDPNGFGTYVRQKITSGTYKGCVCYYGHMSKVNVRVGQAVKAGDLLGVEGSTGKSTGSHCHLEVRATTDKSSYKNIAYITDIPNKSSTKDKPVYYISENTPKISITYYKVCPYKGLSFVDALNSIKVNSAFGNRLKIATLNGIKLYVGTSAQNTKLLNLLKKGKLIKSK